MYCIAFTNYSKNKIFQTRYSYYNCTYKAGRIVISESLGISKSYNKKESILGIKTARTKPRSRERYMSRMPIKTARLK